MSKQQDGTLIEIIKPKIASFIDTPLRDPRLSWKAKGIASYLLSKPPGWQIWTGDLIRRSTDGKAAVFAALKELETYGYLTRERLNDERGRIHWRKSMSATPTEMWNEDDAPRPGKPVMAAPPPPCTDFPDMVNREMVPPCTDFPYMEKPDMENRTHSISNCSYSDLKEEREGGETATPSEEGMTATPSERGGTATPSEERGTATPSGKEPLPASPSGNGKEPSPAAPSGKEPEPATRFGKEPAAPSGNGKEPMPAAPFGNESEPAAPSGKESSAPSGKEPSPAAPSGTEPSPATPFWNGKEPAAPSGKELAPAAPSGKESAAPSGNQKEPAAPSGKELDGLAIVRRVCDDCFVKISPETVYGYSTVAHIVAEAARWWDETPAHLRPKNAGMLVYRIKTRQFRALTQAEIVACTPHYRWLHGDADEPQQEELPMPEPAAPIRRPVQPARQAPVLDVDDPHAVWRQVLTEFALEMPSNQLDTWIQDSRVLRYEDGRFVVELPNGRYLDWAEDRLRPHIKRKLASIMRRNSIDISFSVAQVAA